MRENIAVERMDGIIDIVPGLEAACKKVDSTSYRADVIGKGMLIAGEALFAEHRSGVITLIAEMIFFDHLFIRVFVEKQEIIVFGYSAYRGADL